MTAEQRDFVAPRGSVSRGRLEFSQPSSRITIGVDSEMPHLARGHFEGRPGAKVSVADGRISIGYPRLSVVDWLRADRRAAHVALSPAVPWELVFGSGVSKLRADLTGLTLESFEIRSGASELHVVLPEPQGVVRLRIGGGASRVALLYPPGVAVTASVGAGVSKLVFGEQRFGAIGGRTRLESRDARTAADRYEIEIGGGASRLTIAERSVVTESTPVLNQT
jgi:hypothetical protein